MNQKQGKEIADISKQAENEHLARTLSIVRDNVEHYSKEVERMSAEIDEMLDHYHDNDVEVYTILSNTTTLRDHMQRALERNIKAQSKPYFGRIVFYDETFDKEESLYIGKGGIAKDTTHWMVTDWRAPAANVYYENGLGKCSYPSPDGTQIEIDLKLKRTYEIEEGKLLDFFDTEVVANDDLLTKYLAKNKQAVLGEIIATIQKEQNEIIRKSPYHNLIVQGVAGSGKTTVAMHRISYILYNYAQRFKPDDFYIVGSNRILLNYITGVLPDLDVYGIRQMTMEQLFVRLLYEDWDEKQYRILPADQMHPKSCHKGTLRWFRELEKYCDRLEWNAISRESVFLNPKQFVEGIQDGKAGVFDRSDSPDGPTDLIELISGETVERYIRQNPHVSVQSKINMLNERLINKLKDQFLGRGVSFTENERKAILKAYRGRYGGKVWPRPVFDLYRDFLDRQLADGHDLERPDTAFDVYDLAALAYLYKRIKETEVISEAHHVVIDEAQDFGMMAYCVLKFCIKDCTYTIMGDVSQNIHFGYGLNDWEELKDLILTKNTDTFGILKKSYRNTVEISDFAAGILNHGQFSIYPVEPIIRHGSPVQLLKVESRNGLLKKAADLCKEWQQKGLDTIAVVCRDRLSAKETAACLQNYVQIMDSDLEETVFGSGIMVLPVEYTKGLEFDAVVILDPDRTDYPMDNGHAKLLYVVATRALHELCILYTKDLTGLIADPIPEKILPAKPALADSQILTDSRRPQSANTASSLTRKTTSDNKPAGGRTPAANVSTRRISAQTPLIKSESRPAPAPQKKQSIMKPPANAGSAALPFSFGDMPATENLRPAGHSRIDLAVRWIERQPDGLYLQSRYGILRLSPVGSSIIRVTFTRDGSPRTETNPAIAVNYVDRTWIYKDTAKTVDLLTDELLLQVDKAGGAVTFKTRDKKLLLAERGKECRQIETSVRQNRSWVFFDWQKKENLFAMGMPGEAGLKLNAGARYISHADARELPFVLSDQGYGIVMASSGPAMCCNIPSYGSYLCAEGESQIDYYFIAGKRQNTILQAYGYLSGK